MITLNYIEIQCQETIFQSGTGDSGNDNNGVIVFFVVIFIIFIAVLFGSFLFWLKGVFELHKSRHTSSYHHESTRIYGITEIGENYNRKYKSKISIPVHNNHSFSVPNAPPYED